MVEFHEHLSRHRHLAIIVDFGSSNSSSSNRQRDFTQAAAACGGLPEDLGVCFVTVAD
jgi:hypothetical protein